MGFDEEIRAIEDEIRNTKYNKATSQHIGRLKAKLAKMKDDAVLRAMKSAGGGEGYAVKKRDTHGYRSDIQVLLAYHIYSFKNVLGINHFTAKSFLGLYLVHGVEDILMHGMDIKAGLIPKAVHLVNELRE